MHSKGRIAGQMAIKHILRHLFFAFFLLFLLRILFVLYNAGQFSTLSLWDITEALIQGMRFDLKLIYYTWLPLLLLDCLFRRRYVAVKIMQVAWVILVTVNAGVDTGYFSYSKVRNGREILMFFNSSNNISLWTYLRDYWGLAALLLVMIYSFNRLLGNWRADWPPPKRSRSILVVILALILFIPMRNGIIGRPLQSADAHLFVSREAVPIALNSTLLLFEQEQVNAINTLELDETSRGAKRFYGNEELRKPNFVLIFLESFGKEYTGLNHDYTYSYTPFLDRLMEESLVCTDAYAVGLRSVDAVPGVYSGIPRVGDASFSRTPYAFNTLESINSLLGEIGYQSHFYHGAQASTMGFRSFLKSVEIDRYHSIEDYPYRDRDHDGHWGIYDGPYFEYFATELDTMKPPFVSALFSLSSHHPYSIPEQWEDSFNNGTLDIHESIGYTDRMLANFFKSVRAKSWFDNSIFIILADHSSENAMHAYRTPSGKYEIPLLLYSPKLLRPGKFNETTSQLDVLPTILDLVNYPDSVYTYGESIFSDDRKSDVIHNDNFAYHITHNGWNYGVSQEELKPLFLYNKVEDPNCLDNVLGSHPKLAEELDARLRSRLVEYRWRMEHNAFN